jgi:NADH:ubiquinone reductase (H+-translocating)
MSEVQSCGRVRMDSNLRIGIVGGGFAGLYTVFSLKKSFGQGPDITLFDKNNYFLYTPVLHEMATGTVNARHVVIPIRKAVDPTGVHIRSEEVNLVKLESRAVETPSGTFEFDHLVLAPGSEPNFYCFPNLRENSITFKTIEDAIRLRNYLTGALEKAVLERDSEKRRNYLTITVAGGGCTGVELVAEIAQFINIILRKDYPEINRSDVRIILVEAMDRILPTFPRYLSNIAMERLRQMGVEILLNSPIQWVNKEYIGFKDNKLANGILVWVAGVKARFLPLDPEQRRDPNNRVTVNEHLEIPGYQGVYLIGDGALFVKNGIPLPSTASVAVQEAKYVAQDILLHSREKESPPFRFHYRGDMASLGFMFGVAEVYGRQFKGLPAWMIWKAFKLGMLPQLKNRFQIVADWIITLLFKRDTSKLM